MKDIKSTVLYGLSPFNSESVFVESLTSYITRLAEKHVVRPGTLISSILAPDLHKQYLDQSRIRGGNRFYDGVNSLNGYCKSAQDFTCSLSFLTGVDRLEKTTLQQYSDFFSLRNLLRKSLAWCSKCLEVSPYYPLIWALNSYTTCGIHSILLEDKCASCDSYIPFLHRDSSIGICPFCKRSHFTDVNFKSPSFKDAYISHDLESFFNHFKNKDKSTPNGKKKLKDNIRKIIDGKFKGKSNYFAKYISVSKTTMWDWEKGDIFPPLNHLLEICFRLGISIWDMYNEVDIEKIKLESSISDSTNKKSYRKEKKELNKLKIKHQLSEIGNSNLYNSITSIAQELNCSTKYLYTHFSKECKRISDNNRRILKRKLDLQVLKNKQLIREQFQNEINEGNFPTRKKLEQMINIPRMFKNKIYREYYFELYEIYSLKKGVKTHC